MRILFIGDIFGRPGRQAVTKWLPQFRMENSIDLVIANGENSAGGKGITRSVFQELTKAEIDVFTGGNHSFRQREALEMVEREPNLLRPANLPPGTPGHGMGFYDTPSASRLAVINLLGRAFMTPMDCPYRLADELVAEARRITPNIIVDFHAEATSEKVAMAAYLEGRVSAVIGTHTHVPTGDARILAGGTAAITDVGMTGPHDSVIGVETEIVLDQIIRCMPVRHRVATGDVRICAVQVDIDDATGHATAIEPVITPEWRRSV